ncbi:amino acid-binding protein [Aeromicrobium sp. CTD01-1L150]|uniref:amino acid-binding protein n=1 Tax=Aeromicrobium sp. CTD01-1L150 TaxID=3341830 RepID=UPI0035BF5F4A
MAFLLRVELPDVPGSLGSLATALGSAGADIEAIEIVEHRADGVAVDDVLLELPGQVLPDALVTACHELEGVSVHWISRYNAGANLRLDLEAVEAFAAEPDEALERLIDVLPDTFRVDWALALSHEDGRPVMLHGTRNAPVLPDDAATWRALDSPRTLDAVTGWDSTVLAGTQAKDREGREFVVVLGRHGGPDFLASELARLGHIASLAASVQT